MSVPSFRRLVLLALPVVLGALLGLSLVTAPHGYAAAYAYGGAMTLSVLGSSVAAVLFLFRWTRPWGRRVLGVTLLIALGFGGLWGTVEMLGLVTWRLGEHREPVQ